MPTLTRRGAATRERIVAGAAEVVRESGGIVTLDEICARTRTSRGQLFHYFPDGKEQLLLAVAEREAARVLEDQQPELDALDRWESWLRWQKLVLARYREQGRSCPLSTVLTEVGRSTPASRAITSQLIAAWEGRIAAGATRMQDAGLVDTGLDAVRFARATVAGIQGGVVIMLATGGLEHLEAALEVSLAELRSHASASQRPPIR